MFSDVCFLIFGLSIKNRPVLLGASEGEESVLFVSQHKGGAVALCVYVVSQ